VTRSIGDILGELRTLHSLQADAHVQLASVRRQQLEQASHEASLLAALDGRGKKIDRVLDEYTTAMAERCKETA
jgi:hypothetical protein